MNDIEKTELLHIRACIDRIVVDNIALMHKIDRILGIQQGGTFTGNVDPLIGKKDSNMPYKRLAPQ